MIKNCIKTSHFINEGFFCSSPTLMCLLILSKNASVNCSIPEQYLIFFLGNRKDIYTSSFNISQDKFKFITTIKNFKRHVTSHAKWVNVFDGNTKRSFDNLPRVFPDRPTKHRCNNVCPFHAEMPLILSLRCYRILRMGLL